MKIFYKGKCVTPMGEKKSLKPITKGVLIAQYTANVSGIVPAFNDGYVYEIKEVDNGDGTYTVKIYSDKDFSSCSFKRISNLLTVEYLKVTNKVTNMSNMFYNCIQLKSVDTSGFDTTNVTTMGYMFNGCHNLAQLDVSNFDTSNVEIMNSTFRDCYNLTQLDLSSFNTSNVINMEYMFDNCTELTSLNVSSFDTSKVTSIGNIFGNCSKLIELIAENCNETTLSKLISRLPIRKSSSYGTIKAGKTTDAITSSANAKYWNVDAPVLIARYTANASGVVPTFNEGYEYTVNETVSDEIYTVELYSYSDFTSCSFNGKSNLLTVEYLKVTDKVTRMSSMFFKCSKLTQLNISNWDTSKVTRMDYMFYYCSSLTQLDVSNLDTSKVTQMDSMFYTCSSLTQLDVSNLDTSKVTNMNAMFGNCPSLTRVDASNWDTSQVTNMSYMFYNCPSLARVDVSNWDTSQVTNMSYMFNSCSSLNNVIANNVSTSTLSKLITALPTKSADSYGTIKATETTDEITSSANAKYWNIKVPMLVARYTAKASRVVPTFNSGYEYTVNETVSDGIYTVEIKSDTDFTSCSFKSKSNLLTVEYLKVTSSVTNMKQMFYGCGYLSQLDVSNWDTSNVTDMNNMFYECLRLTQIDVSNFNTSNVKNMDKMFYYCKQLTQLDLSNFNTSNVTNMAHMFNYCSSLTQLDVSNFNTSNVTNMGEMFENCLALTQIDISNFDIKQTALAQLMFYNCTSLNNVIANNVSTSTLSKLIANLPTRTSDSYGTIKATETTDEIISSANAKYWNVDAPMLIARYTANASGVVPTFNSGYQYTIDETESNGVYTVKIYSDEDFTSCSFDGKSNLLTVEYLKVTNNVTNMNYMFHGCTKLTSVDVSGFNTENVTVMNHMFRNCSQLTQLDTSNWDTSSVISMYGVFQNCSQLTQLDTDNWDTGSVTRMDYMFNGCSRLTQLDLSNWDTSSVISIYGMFQSCSQLTQLDISNWDTGSVTSKDTIFSSCPSLNNIIATNVSTSTLSTLITVLPTKSASSYGTIKATMTTDEITSSANAKYWNIKAPMLVARYTANASGVVPTFNSGYQYTINETESDGIYTVEIKSEDDFSSCSFKNKTNLLTVEYLKVTDKVTSMKEMFYSCTQLTQLDVSNWDTSKVADMYSMFRYCSKLTQLDASNWDTSKVADMGGMFFDCSKLTQLNVSNWDTGSVTNMYNMFSGCSQLTQLDLSSWITSSVTNTNSIFYGCSQLVQLDVSNWDTSNVTNMSSMFYYCISLNNVTATNVSTSTLAKLVTALPTRTSTSYGTIKAMNATDNIISSANAKYWNIDAPMLVAKYTANVSGVVPTFNSGYQYIVNETESDGVYTVEIKSEDDFTSCIFNGKTNLLTVEYLKVTNKITSMYEMFYNCTNLTQVDASNWDTSKVKNMQSMFTACSKLTQLDLSNWDTSSVTDMTNMFFMCKQLTQLDMSNWNTSKVTFMTYMFYDCSKLTQLDVSNWDTGKVTDMTNTFYNCTSLNNVVATNVSTSTLSKLINVLPTRKSDSYGTIKAKETTDAIISSANAKYWNITPMLIAQYKYYKPTHTIDTDSILYQIPEPIIFDSGFIDTGIQLLKNDSDWTMFLDCIPNIIGNTAQAVIHCVDESGTWPGISFSFEPNGCINLWDGTKGTVIGQGDYSNKNIKIVIVKKGSNIIIYHNDDPLYQIDSPITIPYTFKSVNSTLSISGGHLGEKAMHLFTGSINNFVLYNEALEDQECNFIISNNGLLPEIATPVYQIPESITFNNSGFMDTGIQLLKNDSDWTIFLDCIPNLNNKTQAVMHCVDEYGSYPGISLSFEPNGCIGLYDGTKGTVIGQGDYSNKNIKIVIVKKGTNIIIYHNYSSSIQYQEDYPIIIPYIFKNVNSTLSIGGGHNGALALHDFSGLIKNFVIYNKALESEDCESIINNDPRPIFNDDFNFNYTIEDKYLDTEDTVTRSIYADTDFTSCRFEGESGLATVEYLKVTNKVTTMDSMFYNCFNMTSVNANGWDTSNVTSMANTFGYCCHLGEITGIENWNTGSLEDLTYTFICCCVNLKSLNLNGWDTSNVTSMVDTFCWCCSLEEIGIENWDTSSLTDLSYTFNCCESLPSLNLSGWDTSNVTSMLGTFSYCCHLEEITGIENWDTSSLEDLSCTFMCCDWLPSLNLSGWDTSNVTSMVETFCWCCSLEEIIGIENWNTDSLTDLTYTFMCCESLLSLNLSGWDTSNVTLTDETFSNCTYLEELDISNWDLSNADPYWLSYMFYISEFDPDSEDWYDPEFKPYLKTIRCNNANTISLIAPYLPDRSTCEEAGIIFTDNVSEVNTEELADLNWNVI